MEECSGSQALKLPYLTQTRMQHGFKKKAKSPHAVRRTQALFCEETLGKEFLLLLLPKEIKSWRKEGGGASRCLPPRNESACAACCLILHVHSLAFFFHVFLISLVSVSYLSLRFLYSYLLFFLYIALSFLVLFFMLALRSSTYLLVPDMRCVCHCLLAKCGTTWPLPCTTLIISHNHLIVVLYDLS